MASGNWDELKERTKTLRGLLSQLSSSDEKKVKCKVKCEVKKMLNSSVAYYECPRRYEDNYSVLQIISGRSLSSLEAAFMWLGSWRPSAAVSLVFSVMGVTKQGIQVEIPVNTLEKPDQVSPLSTEQITLLIAYRDHASYTEKDLTEELATIQMMLPDEDVVTQVMSRDGSEDKIKEMIETRICSLRDVLKRADQLRIRTMLELHALLLPVQAAHCAIAAFEVAFVTRSISSATPPASTS